MSVLLRTLSIGLAFVVGIFPICLHAQAIKGPVLGYVSDAAGAAVRPLLGIPGASSLGERLSLDADVRQLQVSSQQDYILAVRNDDESVVLFNLAASTLSGRPLAFPPGASLLSISPSGLAAATYQADTRVVYTIAGLPGNPGKVRTFDASQVSGRVAALAVSDDGTLALVRSERNDGEQSRTEFSVIDDLDVSWRVPADGAAVAFVPGSRDIVVADNLTRNAFLVRDIGRSYARLPLLTLADDAEMFSDAAMSADGLRVFVTTQSGMVAIVNVVTGQTIWVSCKCRPTILAPLNGPALFRLTEVHAAEPLIVLDASSTEPRFVMTPPNTLQ